MERKVCVVIVEDDLVFVIKNKDKVLWRFPTFDETKDDKLFVDVDKRIVARFHNTIKHEWYIAYVNKEKLSVDGELYALTSRDFLSEIDESLEYKWISLEEIDLLEWDEVSACLLSALKLNLMKQNFTVTIDKTKPSYVDSETDFEVAKRNLDIYWSGCSSKIEADRKFIEAIKKQGYRYHVLKTIPKWRVVRLYDENGKQIMQES